MLSSTRRRQLGSNPRSPTRLLHNPDKLWRQFNLEISFLTVRADFIFDP